MHIRLHFLGNVLANILELRGLSGGERDKRHMTFPLVQRPSRSDPLHPNRIRATNFFAVAIWNSLELHEAANKNGLLAENNYLWLF